MAALSQVVAASGTSAVAFVLTILVLYTVVSTVISYRRLCHINGPFLAKISQLWLFRATVQHKVYSDCVEALKQYGSPCRIGPNMILTDDPEFHRHMSAPRSAYVRGHWYKGMRFDPRVDNILSMTDEKRHAELRTKLMPGYSGKEVPSLEADIDARVLEFIQLIRREYVEKNKFMDFAKLAQFFTLDVLTKIAFGYPFGFLTKNQDLYDYNKSSTEFFPILELSCNIPFVNKILTSSFMQTVAAPKPDDKLGFGAIIGICQKVVGDRFRSIEKHEDDMLGSFIKHGLTQEEAESESMLQILAGADSTATTVRCTFLFILTNAPVYTKLVFEIREAVQSGRISFPVITDTEAQALPYLQACVREGLRIWQPLVGLGTRRSPPQGETWKGVFIPGGVEIGVSTTSMMKRKEVFGPDADSFRPERWLEADTETLRAYERTWEITFGSGRSSCLGKGIALMELGKIFVELLRNYDWGIVNPINPMQSRCNSIFMQREFNLRAWPRKG